MQLGHPWAAHCLAMARCNRPVTQPVQPVTASIAFKSNKIKSYTQSWLLVNPNSQEFPQIKTADPFVIESAMQSVFEQHFVSAKAARLPAFGDINGCSKRLVCIQQAFQLMETIIVSKSLNPGNRIAV